MIEIVNIYKNNIYEVYLTSNKTLIGEIHSDESNIHYFSFISDAAGLWPAELLFEISEMLRKINCQTSI